MGTQKQFKILPLDMIAAPNSWAPLDVWQLTSPSATTLWFQLRISDSLGERRYMPAAGVSQVQVVFQRADAYSMNQQNQNVLNQAPQSITKVGAAHPQDASLFSVSLTAADVAAIRGGTVKVVFTENGVINTFVQNWLLNRSLTDPGC